MSRSIISTVNTSTQQVTDGGTVALGSITHRYGCNLGLNDNAIVINGFGYYDVDCTVIAAPTEVGTITATLYRNNVAIPGATSSFTVSAADDIVTLTIPTVIREACACQGPTSITCVLSGVASEVSNVTMKVVKE